MRRIVVFGAVCFLALVLIIPYTSAANPAPNVSWSKTYGGENYDQANSIIQTSGGGYAIAGYTDSYGAGKHDFWLVKLQGPESKEVFIYVAVGAIIVAIVALVMILFKRRRGD